MPEEREKFSTAEENEARQLPKLVMPRASLHGQLF